MTELFILFQKIAPQHLLSRIAGLLANSRCTWWKNFFITAFARKYQVDLAEAEYQNPEDYPHFNAFFTRALKPEARTICSHPQALACPADGVISQIGNIQEGKLFQAKGHSFSAEALLGDKVLAKKFSNGNFATIYLSPKDYHRVHSPCDATLQEMLHIPGKLYSVNGATAENIPNLFARNERVVSIFETEKGPLAVVLVGAMIVASIETVWAGAVSPKSNTLTRKTYPPADAIRLDKGHELGRFKLGSTVILLFPNDVMAWDEKLIAGSPVKMGQKIGQMLGNL